MTGRNTMWGVFKAYAFFTEEFSRLPKLQIVHHYHAAMSIYIILLTLSGFLLSFDNPHLNCFSIFKATNTLFHSYPPLWLKWHVSFLFSISKPYMQSNGMLYGFDMLQQWFKSWRKIVVKGGAGGFKDTWYLPPPWTWVPSLRAPSPLGTFPQSSILPLATFPQSFTPPLGYLPSELYPPLGILPGSSIPPWVPSLGALSPLGILPRSSIPPLIPSLRAASSIWVPYLGPPFPVGVDFLGPSG